MTSDQAKQLVRDLLEHRKTLRRRPESTGDYWNGDGWGSIQGFKDADNWLENEMAAFVVKWMKEVKVTA